jgi:hypothetical protein
MSRKPPIDPEFPSQLDCTPLKPYRPPLTEVSAHEDRRFARIIVPNTD